MTSDDIEILEKTTPYKGYFRIDQYRLRHRLYGGGVSAEMTREIFERGHAVACLPYDPVNDKLVLIEQFRPGAFAALASPWFDDATSPWLIEVIAGIIEPGESPEQVVRREAVEEAGCEILEIEPIRHYLVSPGGSSESVFTFCGRVDSTGIGGIHGLPHEGEDIRVFLASPDEAYQMLDDGRINNAMTIIVMQWFRANRQMLRDKWLDERQT